MSVANTCTITYNKVSQLLAARNDATMAYTDEGVRGLLKAAAYIRKSASTVTAVESE
jgi:hypothetical protein